MMVGLNPVKHSRTSSTRQYVGNSQLLDLPKFLEIVQIDPDPGYYLIQFDSNDVELTDTYHETIIDAQEQARREFQVSLDEWTT